MSTRFSPSMEMSRLTRDGTAEPVRPHSEERTGTGKMFIFPVQLTTGRIGNLTRLIHTLAVCDDHAVGAYYSPLCLVFIVYLLGVCVCLLHVCVKPCSNGNSGLGTEWGECFVDLIPERLAVRASC